MMNRIACTSLCALLLGTAPALAQVATMDVAPATIHLSGGQSGLFYVSNHGAQPVHVQIEAMDWNQKDGTDKLTSSDTLFASPPVSEIAPGARQTVRVMAAAGLNGSEIPHRLVVSQLPDEAGTSNPQGVRVLLQFSVPVFVGPEPKDAPALAWDATQTADGMDLAVRNDGDFTAKCVRLALSSNGRAVSFDPGAVFYVLPHSSRHFQVSGHTGNVSLRLTGHDLRSDRDFAADITLHR